MLLIILFLAGAFWIAKNGLTLKSYPEPPLTLVDDSVDKTIQVAAERGWVPCTGNCLRLSMPGWHHQDIAGHPPSDIWMTYPFAGGGWTAYSQHHIGHIIRIYSDKPAEDVGNCPVCGGTGWIRKDEANAKK
jgi:hypothetical protein